jgi:CRP-like cAMP-binding protein
MNLSQALPAHAAWFDLLDDEQQARVLQDTAVAHVEAGTIVEHKGVIACSWIGVLEGLVKVSVGNAEGKLASLTGVPAGGWIGEGSLLKREARKYDIIALRRSTIARLRGDTFYWLLDASIPFNRYLLHQLNERVAQFIGKAEYDRLLAPDARVARCLAELFNPLLYPGNSMRLEMRVEYGAVQVLDLDGLKHYGI